MSTAIPRGVVAVLVGASAIVAYRAGGGAEQPAPPPAGIAHPAVAPLAKPKSADAYQATVRFVDALAHARIDAPGAAASRALLANHWRKMQAPWTGLEGETAHLAMNVALRSSPPEKIGASDPRFWNQAEGSFDQREAIVAPAPATFAFKTTIPAGARLTFSPGTLNVAIDAVMFEVVLVDARNAEHVVYTRRVPPAEMRGWIDASVDLAEYAGQDVELRFKTTMAVATPAERKAAEHRPPAQKPASAEAAPAPAAKDLPGEKALATPNAMSLAAWGNPTLLAKQTPSLPYNIVWISVDSLRGDALASLHNDAEDAAKQAVASPPLEALLPKIDGLMPSLDALASRSVRFLHAYSAASWARPGTLAMLAGARSSELGIDTLRWQLATADVDHFYASHPPLMTLLVRREGALTRAFTNNAYLAGYTPVGVDMGFERVDDHRYKTRDSAEISARATQWIKANRDSRFFVFCNYASPHDPYEPPQGFLDRVPPPPAGPREPAIRQYLGEAAKDDEAIGAVLAAIDEAGLRERTLVVMTADQGETLSSAHTNKSNLDHQPMRFHHAAGLYEETTHVPLLISAPGLTPRVVKERVRTTDIAPTLLELEGLDASVAAARAKMSGRSLVPLARGETESDARVVVSEGRGTRSISSGKYRLVVRDAPAQSIKIADKDVTVTDELYDLEADPGERIDLAHDKPDVVAEMGARLDAAMKNVAVAGSNASLAVPAASDAPVVHLRFAGGGRAHRVAGTITADEATLLRVEPVAIAPESYKVDGGRMTLSFATAADGIVGMDLRVLPPSASLHWDLTMDDAPWPDAAVYAGPYGLVASSVRTGIIGDDARAVVTASSLPFIDPATDLGLFVTRSAK